MIMSHFPAAPHLYRRCAPFFAESMGMPVLLYRWYFGAFGVRGFERSILRIAGIEPIRESFYGLTFSNDKLRVGWIRDMRKYGMRGN